MKIFDKIFSNSKKEDSSNNNDILVNKLKRCTNFTYNEIYDLSNIDSECLNELYYFAQWLSLRSLENNYKLINFKYNLSDYFISHDLEYIRGIKRNSKEVLMISNERFGRLNEYDNLHNNLLIILTIKPQETSLFRFSSYKSNIQKIALNILLNKVGEHIYNKDINRIKINKQSILNKLPSIMKEHDRILNIW